jgi:hypothetical protein
MNSYENGNQRVILSNSKLGAYVCEKRFIFKGKLDESDKVEATNTEWRLEVYKNEAYGRYVIMKEIPVGTIRPPGLQIMKLDKK